MVRTLTERLTASPSPARELVEANSRLERRVGELLLVQEAAQTLAGELRLAALLELALSTVASLAAARAVSVLLVDSAGQALVPAARRGPSHVPGGRRALGTGLAGWVARHQVPLLLPEVEEEPRFRGLARDEGLEGGSFLGVPLVFQDRLLGVVAVTEKAGGLAFDERDLRVLICLAPHLATAIRNAILYADLEARATSHRPEPAGQGL